MRLVQLSREEGRGFAAVQRIADQLGFGVESAEYVNSCVPFFLVGFLGLSGV